jgi:hypothetical protein
MNWNEKQKHLTEQLEILKKLRKRFGVEIVKIASNAKLNVHKKWMKDLSEYGSRRPSEIFKHSAFSVTSDENNFVEYEILEDSDEIFSVKITKCKYADFYIENGEPEIGYAMHCALDYGEAESFSTGIILKRTKTLMQDGDCCDHCYILKS